MGQVKGVINFFLDTGCFHCKHMLTIAETRKVILVIKLIIASITFNVDASSFVMWCNLMWHTVQTFITSPFLTLIPHPYTLHSHPHPPTPHPLTPSQKEQRDLQKLMRVVDPVELVQTQQPMSHDDHMTQLHQQYLELEEEYSSVIEKLAATPCT